MNRDEWLLERRKGIGSSDAAAVCGLKPFGLTPLDVYLDKLGLRPPWQSQAMRIGLLFEDAIAALYEEETGRKTSKPPEPLYRHPDYPWMLASPDRFAGERICELKNMSSKEGWGDPGTDEVPDYILVQVQQQMACCGRDVADVAALFAGTSFAVYEVPRRPDVIDRVIELEAEFWERVEFREPPPLDWEDSRTPELVGLLYRPAKGKVVELGNDVLTMVDVYHNCQRNEKDWADEKARWKAQIVHAMQDAEVGLLPDGREVVRARRHRRAYQVAEGEYTDFRIRKRRVG